MATRCSPAGGMADGPAPSQPRRSCSRKGYGITAGRAHLLCNRNDIGVRIRRNPPKARVSRHHLATPMKLHAPSRHGAVLRRARHMIKSGRLCWLLRLNMADTLVYLGRQAPTHYCAIGQQAHAEVRDPAASRCACQGGRTSPITIEISSESDH